MFRIEIKTEMTTGHKFSDVINADYYDSTTIEQIVSYKAGLRGFKEREVDNYEVTIKSNI